MAQAPKMISAAKAQCDWAMRAAPRDSPRDICQRAAAVFFDHRRGMNAIRKGAAGNVLQNIPKPNQTHHQRSRPHRRYAGGDRIDPEEPQKQHQPPFSRFAGISATFVNIPHGDLLPVKNKAPEETPTSALI